MTTAHSGIDLVDVQMHLHSPADPATAICVANERCTAPKSAAFVRHIAFDVSNSRLVGAFRAGQSFGVLPPGLDANGKHHKVRLYSIASPSRGEDGQGRVFATTVKRTIDEHRDTHKLFLGVASNYLADLRPGDAVRLTGPSGKRFVLPARPADHDYLFFATGTGIAPFRGMVAELLSLPTPPAVCLVMGSAYASDLLYHQHFLDVAARHPSFTYLTAISRERQADGGPPLYVQDRLNTHRDLLAPLLGSHRTLIYICGLAGMELGVFQHLADILPAATLDPYLAVEPDLRAAPKSWTRTMIPRQIRPTRRLALEVY
ncbi:MAG: hypothetical protein ACKVW3_15115 [Phycisphaerales bacterium]